ncbi:MAG: porin family protein [bacterium]|nr:porin family protein [bacterium]
MKHSICVLLVAVFLGCLPGGAQQQWPGGTAPASQAQRAERPNPTARQPELPRYALPPGKVQLGGLYGGSVFQNSGKVQDSIGAQVLVGLRKNLAVYGEGAWNRGIEVDPLKINLGSDFYDLGGGMQLSIPNRSRIVPYFRGGIGLIHLTDTPAFGRWSDGNSGSRFAGSLGAGVRVHLTDRYGFQVGLRGFDGPDVGSIVRTSVGFFYQFK